MKCLDTKSNQSSNNINRNNNHSGTNHQKLRRRSSANWICTSPVGAVTSLIHLLGNQIILFGTRVARSRRHGARALILGRNLRNVPNSIILIAPITILDSDRGIRDNRCDARDGSCRLLSSPTSQGSVGVPLQSRHPSHASLGAVAILGVAVLSIVSSLSFNNVADTYATDSTLSLSIDNSTVSMDIAATNVNGTFSKSSASTISASTNNATGYTLSISAPSNAGSDYNKLINGSDNTAKLSSISSATTEAQFKALNGTAYNGMWGYLPSRYCSDNKDGTTCADNTDFLPAPTTTGDTIDITSTANTTANNYTLAIGARIDDAVKVGAYTNTFIVKLVGNAIPYTITYVDDTVNNMPIDVDTTSPTSTITISSNTPTRNGYTFNGWCTVIPITNTNGTDTCSGTTVQAGGTITINQVDTSQNGFTLHAMWTGNYTIDALVAAGGTLQDFTNMSGDVKSKIYLSMTPEHNYTLKDSRDNQDYTIASLRDGNVWMTKNLNIAGGTTLTCDQTDCDGGYTLPSNQGWQSTAGKLPASSTTGFDTDNYAYVYNSGNTTGCGGSGQNTPCFSYYSWDVATLGSGRSINTQNTDVPYSICPKGWRLPTSGQHDGTTALTNWKRGDFYRLLTAYGANLEDAFNRYTATFWNNAGAGTVANFLLSGYYSGSTFNYGGSDGYYWSSTSTSSTYSRYLNFSTGVVSSANNNLRRLGFSVRCMLR